MAIEKTLTTYLFYGDRIIAGKCVRLSDYGGDGEAARDAASASLAETLAEFVAKDPAEHGFWKAVPERGKFRVETVVGPGIVADDKHRLLSHAATAKMAAVHKIVGG